MLSFEAAVNLNWDKISTFNYNYLNYVTFMDVGNSYEVDFKIDHL